jgi:Phage Tail Collar Domain
MRSVCWERQAGSAPYFRMGFVSRKKAVMRARTWLLLSLSTLAFNASTAAAAADGTAPLVGEVRAIAIAPTSERAIARLHQEGWLECRGQLLSDKDFPELYATVGRTWTAQDVPPDRFAVPDVNEPFRGRISTDNPFGVLGPGDLVTGGRVRKAWERQAPLTYWIFVGRSLGQVGVSVRSQ